MTLEEAIKNLIAMNVRRQAVVARDNWSDETRQILDKESKAVELGIEALKAWKEAQREQRWPSTMRLPGETKK